MPPFVLRGLDVADAAAMHRICSAPAVARTLGTMPTDAVSVYESRLAALDPNTSCLLGAFEGEQLVGLAQMTGSPRPRGGTARGCGSPSIRPTGVEGSRLHRNTEA